MPSHAEKRVLPYTPEQMFDLVADVERYPEFLPWCHSVRVRRWEAPDICLVELGIGFKIFREHFTTRDVFVRPDRIMVEFHEGPFRHLRNSWIFERTRDGRCRLDFHIDFAFRSVLLEHVVGVLFHEAVRAMVSAFERRAAAVYGAAAPSTLPPPPARGNPPA